MVRPNQKQWNDFIRANTSFDGISNVKGDFKTLSKGMAVAYFEYLRVAWIATREHFTELEFCQINGNIPIAFFEKNVRDSQDTKELEIMVSYGYES